MRKQTILDLCYFLIAFICGVTLAYVVTGYILTLILY